MEDEKQSENNEENEQNSDDDSKEERRRRKKKKKHKKRDSEDVSDDVEEDVADDVSEEVSDKVSSGRGDTAGAPFGEGPFPEGEPRETRYRGNESSMRAARQIPSAAALEEEHRCRRVRRGSTGGDISGY